MRFFISILCALIFAFPPICRADGAVFGLSRCCSYVLRGVRSFWGRELPISVYVVKKSGGETAMAVDSAAGTLIKGRFSPGAEKCELFVSELLGDKDKVGGLAADIFRYGWSKRTSGAGRSYLPRPLRCVRFSPTA